MQLRKEITGEGLLWSLPFQGLLNISLSNLLILSFEDMVEDLEREVRKIAEYLEIQLTEEKLTRIVDMCGFTAMKKNDSVNMTTFASANPDKTKSFIRKGKVCSVNLIQHMNYNYIQSHQLLRQCKCIIITYYNARRSSCLSARKKISLRS